MPAVVVFALSAAAVILAGIRLTRDGDVIAERTGLGGAWVGAILVAAATSLPELSTDVYAVRQGHRSLAVADLFGASMANMLILAFADLVTVRFRMLTRVAINQALVGSLAIALTATVTAGILVGNSLSLGTVGWAPLFAVMGYLVGMRLLYVNRPAPPFETATEARRRERAVAMIGLGQAIFGFVAAALVILLTARYLASSAADVADQFGLSHGFVGAALLAGTTTLPEVTVTAAAVRMGSYDLAVGNLLGSNCFNMVILLSLDLVDGGGSLLAGLEPSVTVGAVFAVLLTALTLIGVLNRAERRDRLIEPDALLRIATYGLGLYLVYQIGGG